MSNVHRLPSPPEKSQIEVRMPKFRDASNFIGAIAAGGGSDVMSALDRDFNQAAFVLMLKSALRVPAARDDIMQVLADLWVYEVSDEDIKEPPEEWDYYPREDLVEKGQLISREENWRSISSKNRRRIVKKLMLEDMELDVIGEFIEAFKRLPYVSDFLASSQPSEGEKAGESETPSPEDTVGATGT